MAPRPRLPKRAPRPVPPLARLVSLHVQFAIGGGADRPLRSFRWRDRGVVPTEKSSILGADFKTAAWVVKID
jgi:hypothetical protein